MAKGEINKVGFITIGQSEHDDMIAEMLQWIGPVKPCLKGALDGLSRAQIQSMHPDNQRNTLITRLNNGESVMVDEDKLLPLIQEKITELEEEGTEAVILLCTAPFPPFRHSRPLLTAGSLLTNGVRAIASGSRVGIICPLPEQVQMCQEQWADLTPDLYVVSASPYGPSWELIEAVQTLKQKQVDYIVLDCMGYTQSMKELIRQYFPIPVLLARSLVARLAAEVLPD